MISNHYHWNQHGSNLTEPIFFHKNSALLFWSSLSVSHGDWIKHFKHRLLLSFKVIEVLQCQNLETVMLSLFQKAIRGSAYWHRLSPGTTYSSNVMPMSLHEPQWPSHVRYKPDVVFDAEFVGRSKLTCLNTACSATINIHGIPNALILGLLKRCHTLSHFCWKHPSWCIFTSHLPSFH